MTRVNMRYVTAWVAALVCAGLGSASLLAAFAPSAQVNVEITIDFQLNPRPIPDHFVGVSASASNQGNGVASSGVSTAAAASTAEVRAKVLRFPDDVSQSYHYLDAAVERRMTTFELWSLADAADVDEIMMTVNMVDGAPNEARDWVAYCNAPANTPEGALRAANAGGSQTPFDVRYWLLGEDIRSYSEKYETADDYGAAALRNATLMKIASPGIEVGVWLDDGSTEDGVNWNSRLLAYLQVHDPGQQLNATGPKTIDFVAVAVQVEVPNRPLTDSSLYPSLYGYAETQADEVLTRVEGAMQGGAGKLHIPLKIAVYRYGLDFGREGWNQDKADSLGTAIALSGMLNKFVRHDRVFTAIYAGLNRDGFDSLLKVPTAFDVATEQRFALNPFGEVLSAYGQYAAGQALTLTYAGTGSASEVARAHYRAPALGRIAALPAVPLLSIAATLDGDGQMVFFVSSRSLTDEVHIHLIVKPIPPGAVNAAVYVSGFSSDSLSTDAYTGVARTVAHAAKENLGAASPEPDVYHYDLFVERNSFTSFAFSTGP